MSVDHNNQGRSLNFVGWPVGLRTGPTASTLGSILDRQDVGGRGQVLLQCRECSDCSYMLTVYFLCSAPLDRHSFPVVDAR